LLDRHRRSDLMRHLHDVLEDNFTRLRGASGQHVTGKAK
jgi:hypothetical protein